MQEKRIQDRTMVNRQKFLAALETAPNITAAARSAGISPRTVRDWRQNDPFFAEEMQDALRASVDRAVHVAYRLGVEGFEEPHWFQDRIAGYERKHSESMLKWFVKRMDPYKPARTKEQETAPDETTGNGVTVVREVLVLTEKDGRMYRRRETPDGEIVWAYATQEEIDAMGGE